MKPKFTIGIIALSAIAISIAGVIVYLKYPPNDEGGSEAAAKIEMEGKKPEMEKETLAEKAYRVETTPRTAPENYDAINTTII